MTNLTSLLAELPAVTPSHPTTNGNNTWSGTNNFTGPLLSNGQPVATLAPQVHCFATDSVEKFERLGSRFLGCSTGNVELVDLGG